MVDLYIADSFFLQTSNEWGEAVFEIRTRRSQRLPIKDFAPFVTGDVSQEIELGVGEVCFL